MKKISQEEFENLVQSLINRETTRKKLAKTLETDIRTLNSRIRKLSEENDELYKKYIKKFPYKPKIREDIDFEALVIKIMKNNTSLEKMEEQYGISTRTISRRIKAMEKTNPELIEMYREYANCLKKSKKMPYELEIKIDELVEKPVTVSKVTEKREVELRKTLRKFEELVSGGMSKAEAARALGYDGYPTIWKKQQELERIATEKKVKENIGDGAPKKFRQSMKLDTSELDIGKVSEITVKAKSKEKEGR